MKYSIFQGKISLSKYFQHYLSSFLAIFVEMRGRSRCNEATGEETDSRSITGCVLSNRGASDSKAKIYLS